MRKVFIAAGLLALASAATQLMAQDAPALSTKLQATLEDFLERYALPGATAAIVLPDGTLVTAATGLADVENARAMTDRPWFGALTNADAITIGHLLHHTSGLPDHVHKPAFQQAWAGFVTGEGDIDPEHLVAFAAGEAPLFEAGTGWAYSDSGYVLLGLAIAEVTGRGWKDAVVARLLEPLGLTGTIPSDRPDLPGLAIGYVASDVPFGMPERTADADGRLLRNPAVESAGGGFASTSADLARWGRLLFAWQAMDAPYLDRLLDGVPFDPGAPGILYGAGVAIYADTPNGPVYGYGGWTPPMSPVCAITRTMV